MTAHPSDEQLLHNLIRPRNFTPQQKADLVAFLSRPLTDPRVAAATLILRDIISG